MKLEVVYRNGHYYWVLHDGPDGIDTVKGYCDTMGEVFEKVISHRTLIAKDYYESN